MAVADYVKDQVLVVIQREDPQPVSKEKLQEDTGLGAGDLRAALAELEADGAVEYGEKGYELLDSLQGLIPQAAQPPARTAGEDEDEEPDAPDAPDDAAGGFNDPENGEPICEAKIALTVRYRPEPGEEPVKEAALIAAAAREGITREWPELDVTGRITSVVAYDNPRTLYPAS